jgi:hypothetical protein
MVSHHLINQTAIAAFDRALRQGELRRLINRLRHRSNDLLSYGDLLDHRQMIGQRDLGAQIIPINQIRGSMGRCEDFDRDFFPRRTFTSDRWMSIARAQYQGLGLPLVELHKVGETYFVEDGHHRISVARALGQNFIDAHVIEVNLQNWPSNVADALAAQPNPWPRVARWLSPIFALLINLFV